MSGIYRRQSNGLLGESDRVIAGKYRVVRELAHGAMGSIWEARDEKLDRPVAVKLLHPGARASGVAWSYLARRLLREAQVTASVRHPAIIRAIDFGADESDEPFFVMEMLTGKSFEQLLKPGRKWSPERAVELLLPIADGLSAVHARGVVHRDVKPGNLFLACGPHGTVQPKLIDFGLAKVTELGRPEELTGAAVIGTREYMPPEQMLDSSDVDPRADVWAYSVVLYQVLSGEVPFAGRTCTDVLRAVLGREALPLTTRVGLDAELWAIVARGLQTEREKRWRRMADLSAALTTWLKNRSTRASA